LLQWSFVCFVLEPKISTRNGSFSGFVKRKSKTSLTEVDNQKSSEHKTDDGNQRINLFFRMKCSLLVIWLLLLRVHATEEHVESSTELLCPHQDEDKEQTQPHRPTTKALRSLRDLGKRVWQGFIARLPGERARPQLGGFGAVQGPVVIDLIQIQHQRKARSSSALAIRPETCVKAYPGDELVFVEGDEPHIGIVLEVYDEGAGEARVDVSYQLEEPLHLELGVADRHAFDWAYTPVNASSKSNGAALSQDEQLIEKNSDHAWWEWWLPWGDDKQDHYSQYRMKDGAFAGGSHGEVWRGRRRCRKDEQSETYCKESLIFKLLRVDRGYKILEAGLREVYFGRWLAQQQDVHAKMYTSYVDHFFRERRPGRELELWIVFRDAGPSLRNYLYTGVSVGDYVVFQHSKLWTQLRTSISRRHNFTDDDKSVVQLSDTGDKTGVDDEKANLLGRRLMKTVLRQMIESVAFLHDHGVVHRDIKPSNILCKTNLDLENLGLINGTSPFVHCVLADFSSAWNNHTDWNLYTRGPSRAEQTDEYAPPEAVFGSLYDSQQSLTPQFDS
jgi:hypothetical protein